MEERLFLKFADGTEVELKGIEEIPCDLSKEISAIVEVDGVEIEIPQELVQKVHDALYKEREE